VHGGEKADKLTGAVAPPLIRSKTYRQVFGEEAPWKYSRGTNPTRAILERKLEAITGDVGSATVFASGVAATAMFLLTLEPGDHVIFCQEVYGGTYRLVTQVLDTFGLKADFVDFADLESVRRLVTERTRYFFVETPTNPSLHIVDLEAVKRLSQETGVPYVADLTFAPPTTLQPFAYGAETVIYSLSKYFAGHNDVIAGAVITTNPAVDERLRFFQGSLGAVLSPDECYRVIQGLKTMHLRWERASQTAQLVAEYLARQPEVARTLYPGLPGHPGHEVAQRQFEAGFGSVVSFELATEDKEIIGRFVRAVQQDEIVIYGESLASPETILAYPAGMSHRSLSPQERRKQGIGESFFRLSAGLEEPEDILAALERGLAAIK